MFCDFEDFWHQISIALQDDFAKPCGQKRNKMEQDKTSRRQCCNFQAIIYIYIDSFVMHTRSMAKRSWRGSVGLLLKHQVVWWFSCSGSPWKTVVLGVPMVYHTIHINLYQFEFRWKWGAAGSKDCTECTHSEKEYLWYLWVSYPW